jgi:hypothetical protein
MDEADEVDEDQHAELVELLRDARMCARLTAFETDFLESIEERLAQYGTRLRVSAKQWAVIKRIEGKVWA